MKIDIKKFVGDVKTWIALGAILVAAAGTVVTYASMPKKVEAVEKTANETAKEVEKLKPVPEKVKTLEEATQQNAQNIDKMAGTIDKYVAVHAEEKNSQDKREQLMLELIKAVKEQKDK